MDRDRLRKGLEDRVPDRVYILYNKEPMGIHEDLNEKVLEDIRDLVRETTMCFERDEVVEAGVDFYRFDEALVDIFDIMYKESERGNHVMVNVSGGTKPVAIALAYCCSIVDSGIPIYYVAEDYTEQDSQGETVSSGVVETPFQRSPLQALDLTHILPEAEEKETLLSQLRGKEEPIGVKNLLADAGIITEEPPEDEEEKEKRGKTLSTYHRHIGHLHDDNIVTKESSKYSLSDSGKLIAKLVEARKQARKELDVND